MTEALKANWEQNASFSRQIPRLQTALDSTSLGEFKQCPRKYYYSIIMGYQPIGTAIDLIFGSAAHQALEHFHKRRFAGEPYEDALLATLQEALTESWIAEASEPLFDDAAKSRLSLTRLIVEYCDRYEKEQTGPRTVALANGAPAVELTFAFDSGLASASHEPIVLCGHLDRLVEFNQEIYIADLKTTRSGLTAHYLRNFTPDNQFTLYTLAGRVALHVTARGVLLDAVQVGVTFVRFARIPIPRPTAIIEEWIRGFESYWYPAIQSCAQNADLTSNPVEAYPQNDKACGLYGGCHFREVCGRVPSSRSTILEGQFNRRRWDPLGEPR